MGCLEGEVAIRMIRNICRWQVERNFTGHQSRARGDCVRTPDLDGQVIREYLGIRQRKRNRQAQQKLAGLTTVPYGHSACRPICG
jgi:hypothetical protein